MGVMQVPWTREVRELWNVRPGRVRGLRVALFLALLPVTATHQGVAAQEGELPTLIAGAMETTPPSPDGAVVAQAEYLFASPLPDSVDLGLLMRGRMISTPRHWNGSEWVEIRFWREEDGSLRGRSPLQGDQLQVRWTVIDGFTLQDSEAAMDLPIPTPIVADNGALPNRFGIVIRGSSRYNIRRPFPSNLSYDTSQPGVIQLVGDAPVVPGVVRFGYPELLNAPPIPEGMEEMVEEGVAPGGDLGWPFWGLWIALAGLLIAYGVWMVRRERADDSAPPGGAH